MSHDAESRLRAFDPKKREAIWRELIESGRFPGVRIGRRSLGGPGTPSRRGPTFPNQHTKLRFDAAVQRLLGGESETPGASTSEGGNMVRVVFSDGSERIMTIEEANQIAQGEDVDIFPVSDSDDGGGGGGNQDIGGDQDIGIDGPSGDPQPDPLDPDAILALFTSGENSPQDTIRLLMALGWSTGRISRAMESVNQPGTTLPGTVQPNPIAQGGLEQPGDITDLLKNLGIGDITRRFAIESGVSPDFRNLVQGRANQQLLPFAVQTARDFDPSQLGEGEKLVDLFSTQRFQDFLGNQGGFQSRGSSLRGAADFLRDRQGEDGDFSDPQKIIRGSLLNLGKEGSPNVGSQLFSRLIAEAQAGGTGGRTIPGINVGRAVGSSLENIFARNPGRFSRSAPDFIDFLAGRGLI